MSGPLSLCCNAALDMSHYSMGAQDGTLHRTAKDALQHDGVEEDGA